MKDRSWSIDLAVKSTILKKDVYIAEIKLFDFIQVFMVKSITNVKSAEELTTNQIEKNSIDLIFADPPYNLSGNGLKWEGNKTGGGYFAFGIGVSVINKWLSVV